MPKVNRHTRAGKNGKLIICPACNKASTVFHFAWVSLFCMHCRTEVAKSDWDVDVVSPAMSSIFAKKNRGYSGVTHRIIYNKDDDNTYMKTHIYSTCTEEECQECEKYYWDEVHPNSGACEDPRIEWVSVYPDRCACYYEAKDMPIPEELE